MTPDEARDLVASFEGRRLAADYEAYGLADGYQHIEHYVILEIDGEHPETGESDVWTDTLGMPDKATADMIAAAPTLAALFAGMHEEWGVSCGGEKPGAWWASREEADQCAKRMGICIHYPLPIVVVRRYVTTPEAVDAVD